MFELNENEVLTKVTKYNLMSPEKSILIDVHKTISGRLAGKYIAVPSLVMVIAGQEYQGVGETEEEALKDCLDKIRNASVEDIFPKKG